MADNYITSPGAGGVTFASDEDGGFIHWPLIKLAWGPLDTFNIVADAAGKRLPVDSVQSGAWSVSITGSVAVTGPLTDAQLRASAVPVSGTFFQATQPVSIAATVTVDTELPAAAALADNTANPTAPAVGAFLMAWDGTNWDRVQTGAAAGGALKVDGSAVTQPVSAASLPLPTGAATSALQTQPGVDIGDVTINNAAGAGAVNIQDGGNSITVDGTVSISGALDTELPAAAALADNVANPTVPGVGAFLMAWDGTNWDRVQTGAAAGGALKVDGSAVTQPVSGTVAISTAFLLDATFTTRINTQGQKAMAASTPVVLASDQAAISVNATLVAGTGTQEVVGDVAHDAPIGGNPLRIGARALTTDYTAVATGDAADTIATILGKIITKPYALPGHQWQYAAVSGGIVNTTAVTIKAAGAAGVRNYITDLQIVNGHATTSTDIQVRDGAAGTTLWRGWCQAAGGGYSIHFNSPLRGSTATLLEVVCGTTGAAVYVDAQGYEAAE